MSQIKVRVAPLLGTQSGPWSFIHENPWTMSFYLLNRAVRWFLLISEDRSLVDSLIFLGRGRFQGRIATRTVLVRPVPSLGPLSQEPVTMNFEKHNENSKIIYFPKKVLSFTVIFLNLHLKENLFFFFCIILYYNFLRTYHRYYNCHKSELFIIEQPLFVLEQMYLVVYFRLTQSIGVEDPWFLSRDSRP